MAPLPRPVLCLVTDRRLCRGRELEQVVEAAVEGGCGMVQLREKDLKAGKLLDLAVRLRSITSGRALLIVNDRVDVALAAGADGVQLPEDGLPVEAARQVGGNMLVGRSVHSVAGGVQAVGGGGRFPGCGQRVCHGIASRGRSPQGLGLISGLAGTVDAPVIGIGGIDGGNVESVVRSGASGVAVIRAISESESPEQAARDLKRRMVLAWEHFRAGARRSWLDHGKGQRQGGGASRADSPARLPGVVGGQSSPHCCGV